MILSKALVRSNSSRHAATKISSQWRGYKCMVVYNQVKKGVSTNDTSTTYQLRLISFHPSQSHSAVLNCQTAIRQLIARRKLDILRHECLEAIVTSIQTRWRLHRARRQFIDTRRRLISIQSTIRMWSSKNYFDRSKQASIKISSQWRRYYRAVTYKQTIRGM
jgi:hypothetical protein